jgi:hypothetical protein
MQLHWPVKIFVAGCFLASLAEAGQPVFITAPPPVMLQLSGNGSANLNQAAMQQVISRLNERQFQLSVAAAQSSVQRPVILPQTVTIQGPK